MTQYAHRADSRNIPNGIAKPIATDAETTVDYLLELFLHPVYYKLKMLGSQPKTTK